ncbi:MAG: class I SAM-dependent methyltransferase [Betaproteobacteria bacterium]|nr:class I SAM-dependent methyltransferase [Betaproteobacteria bacterium]
MSGATVAEFLAYWHDEGEVLARQGDYAWMAEQLPGQRVLEIGCGPGWGTAAMLGRGVAVMTVDNLDECLAETRERCPGANLQLLAADIETLAAGHLAAIAAFAPDTVACWLMGAPADVTSAAAGDGGKAVAAYRERIHRRTAELAASLASVRWLHLVDRTAMAWQAKDIGRDTLIRYHGATTLAGLPFAAHRAGALYRKLAATRPAAAHPALRGMTPVLASLLAERKN